MKHTQRLAEGKEKLFLAQNVDLLWKDLELAFYNPTKLIKIKWWLGSHDWPLSREMIKERRITKT